MVKPQFAKYELDSFGKFCYRLKERNGISDLILAFNYSLYAFSIIELEINHKTKLGRKLLDRIIELRLI